MVVDLDELRGLPEPLDRARRAGEVQDRLQVMGKEVSRIRREAIEELLRGGMTQTQLAVELGMSRGRIGQLVSSGPPPERAFFGDDTVTIAVGQKIASDSSSTGPAENKPAMTKEDFISYERLRELLSSLQLDAQVEFIPPPGMIRLNRSNLVVICGPRLSPLLGQVLESDPVLGFERDDEGWHLVDRSTNTTYRSPLDKDNPGDVAYFGRLPRPDGRGLFTYMAGIHAAGPMGVVHYLTTHLGEVYREVRGKRFSTLIESEFDADSREVQRSRRLTSVYIHDGH